MPHINVHERRTGEEMIGLGGHDCDAVFAQLANLARGGNARNAVSDDDDVLLHVRLFFYKPALQKTGSKHNVQHRSGFIGCRRMDFMFF